MSGGTRPGGTRADGTRPGGTRALNARTHRPHLDLQRVQVPDDPPYPLYLCASAQLGYALRASAGPAGAEAGPAAPAGGPQPRQPDVIRQQFGGPVITRNGDHGPDPAAGHGQPLPRPAHRGAAVQPGTHTPIFTRSATSLAPLAQPDERPLLKSPIRSGSSWVRWCIGGRMGWSMCGSRAGAAPLASRVPVWHGDDDDSGPRRCTRRSIRRLPRESHARSRSARPRGGRVARCIGTGL